MEVGLDECARGPGFGRMYGSAVILDSSFMQEKPEHVLIRDSKALTEKQRELSYQYIISHCFEYAVSFVEPWEIDKHGVTWANQKVFHDSLSSLHTPLSHIYVDGTIFRPYHNIHHTCLVKGDALRHDISCASIIAKVSHDRYIQKLCKSEDLQHYHIYKNKGYLTKDHIKAIQEYGITKYHRKIYLKNILPFHFKDD